MTNNVTNRHIPITNGGIVVGKNGFMAWGRSEKHNFPDPHLFKKFLDGAKQNATTFKANLGKVQPLDLLDQMESECFMNPEALGKITKLIPKMRTQLCIPEMVPASTTDFPNDFQYSPAEKAIGAYREILGTSLSGQETIKLAKQAIARPESEGIAVWPKLSSLAKLFGIRGNPIENTDEGREAYAQICAKLIGQLNDFKKMTGLPLDFFSSSFTAERLLLTIAGRKTWEFLERQTGDDFCFSPAGAGTATKYKGHTASSSRLEILLSGNEFGQDIAMTASTLLSQRERMAKRNRLGMLCTANVYFPHPKLYQRDILCWDFGKSGNFQIYPYFSITEYNDLCPAIGYFS